MCGRGPILRVAVPTPLFRTFDYLPASDPMPASGGIGCRVAVPFGRGRTVGVVVALSDHSEVAEPRLRPILTWLDKEPLIPSELLSFLSWTSRYYHHPVGETLATALPVLLRQGKPAEPGSETVWAITEAGRAADQYALAAHATRQAKLLARLKEAPSGATLDELRGNGPDPRGALNALRSKGYVESSRRPLYRSESGANTSPSEPPALNPDQLQAVAAITANAEGFDVFLLDGVTGSGKTEVYLTAMEQIVNVGRQVLVLVPEIGLTPQLVDRFRRRFRLPLAVMHSGLSLRERLSAWLAAATGDAGIVIGTRSAIFTPLARPGLIVVDEEHDLSFKQQDGLRYSARDLAVVRASRLKVPLIMGSATPSLESLLNAKRGRYRHLSLASRAAGAAMPEFRVVDVRGLPLEDGLSPPLLGHMDQHLAAGGQILLFLNRRGFAPTLICHDCGWISECPRCDARLTYHRARRRLRCHHCGHDRRVAEQCPECGSADLRPLGQGTERLEQFLGQRYPDIGIVRIDRDSTRRHGAMERLLDDARHGKGRILLGTQMLAKGHDLPEISLAAVVDADHGLFGSDFRAPERMAQLIVQVAGRAGRAARSGEVVIQTHHPEHPLLQTLLRGGYGRFAEEALQERRLAALPPYSFLALLRAEAPSAAAPEAFLRAAMASNGACESEVQFWGPATPAMERRAGRYRAQLLIQSTHRTSLQRFLDSWVPALPKLPEARKVRWSVDVDPMETA